jgi:hypothetical protein
VYATPPLIERYHKELQAPNNERSRDRIIEQYFKY